MAVLSLVAVLNLIGGILLIVGWVAAYAAARSRSPVPAAGWFPDPSRGVGERWWDGWAWTPHVQGATVAGDRGRLFRGRFWGGWVWLALGAIAVLVLGCFAFSATGSVNLIALASFLAMSGVCWAFYRFVARQLALTDVIGRFELVAVMVASAGGVVLIASNANAAVIGGAGIRTGLVTVGFIEEAVKLLVPLTLYLAGRYRDPRAGIAIALASGFGFAIIETTQYAYANASASGPSICGGPLPRPTIESVIQAQVYRIFLVSPLHWLWIAFAVAVAWRLWHLYGAKGIPGAIGAILLAMVIHSANDTSAVLGCDDLNVAFRTQLFRWALLIVMYLLFKAAARQSTPPQLIGAVSRGWAPHHLRTYTRSRAFVEE